MKYPDLSNAKLVAYQDRLAKAINSPEAAESMFGFMHQKLHKDPAALEAKARKTLEAHRIDPDGPMPEQVVETPAAAPEPATESQDWESHPAFEIAEPTRNRPPRFWVRDEVFDQGLTPHEFVVYAFLCRSAGKSRRCWPSITTITRHCRVKRHTAVAALDGLEDRGLIECRKRFQKTSVYTITTPDMWRPVVPKEALLVVPETALLAGAQ